MVPGPLVGIENLKESHYVVGSLRLYRGPINSGAPLVSLCLDDNPERKPKEDMKDPQNTPPQEHFLGWLKPEKRRQPKRSLQRYSILFAPFDFGDSSHPLDTQLGKFFRARRRAQTSLSGHRQCKGLKSLKTGDVDLMGTLRVLFLKVPS